MLRGFLNCLKEMAGEALESILPDRTKRLIVLSSLCPKFLAQPEITPMYLSMLNTQLSLCREEAALRLPIALANYIWPQLEDLKTHATTEVEYERLAQGILRKLPAWLKYDKEPVISSEINVFLHFNDVYEKSQHQNMVAG